MREDTQAPGQSGVQSLDRAFGLLEALSLRPEGMGLMELCEACGLHKSTVHRLLAALTALGYVGKAADGVRYRLTLRLVELSGRIVDGFDVTQAAKPVLDRLRDSAGETVHLVVRDGCDIVYTYKAESTDASYRMASRIGLRRAMYCTAAGKSILATLPDGEVEEIWRGSEIIAHTPHTIVTLGGLMEEIGGIRHRGYALDNEENELVVRCIAGAVQDHTGTASAAFSISAPVIRMDNDRVALLADEVLAARAEISAGL